jgi:hypothetical protein
VTLILVELVTQDILFLVQLVQHVQITVLDVLLPMFAHLATLDILSILMLAQHVVITVTHVVLLTFVLTVLLYTH